MLKFHSALCAFAIITFPALGQTVTLVDSTSNTINSSDSVSELGPLGFSFSTGGSSVNLTQVQISVNNPLNCLAGPSNFMRSQGSPFMTAGFDSRSSHARFINVVGTLVSPGIIVQLYSNNPTGPQPGSALTTIGSVLDNTITNCNSLLTLPLGTAFALSANTRYWVVVTTPNSSILQLNMTDTASGTGVLSEFFFEDGSSNMNDLAFIGSASGTINSSTPSTPAPSSLLLTLAGLACVGLWLGRGRLNAAR